MKKRLQEVKVTRWATSHAREGVTTTGALSIVGRVARCRAEEKFEVRRLGAARAGR